jgi:iron complex outermembrane recepter protein
VRFSSRGLFTAFTLSLCAAAAAQTPPTELPSVLIEGTADNASPVLDQTLDADRLASERVSTSDTASLLPGVDAAQNGGVSSLPTVRGLGDDRLRTLVDGVPISSACPMHMNPVLSYIDPTNVMRVDVLPGVTPVSVGGDSIAGTILVESAAPHFASDDRGVESAGSFSSVYRSNSSTVGASAAASLATDALSVAYQGSGARADDYRDGAGDLIRASRFETSNQQVTLAGRDGSSLYELQAAVQYMPYEGFPNGDMDLSNNVGAFVNARYRHSLGWGELSVSAYYNRVHHEMNGNAPDRYPPSPVDITSMGLMPTIERGEDLGYRAELDVPLTAQDMLRVGNELHEQRLDDRWPGAPVGMPFDYVNLNHATRLQLGTFAEWQRRWSSQWSTLLGVRNDTIWMNTGPVQGYDGVDPTAQAFNAQERARTDVNVDASVLARYQPDDEQTYRFGLGSKTRSPNLYERYAWGTSTIGMVTWFGDGNGYTGRPSLEPETARTASLSAQWHDHTARLWQVEVTPYFTMVEHYIGVQTLCGPECTGAPEAQLLFANHRARLYGVDASAAYTLVSSARWGLLRLAGSGGFVRGEDLTSDTNLYHMMPLNGLLALEHTRGGWSSRLELRVVGRKDEVDPIRLEPPTAGYTTLDLRTAYVWRSVRLDFAVVNLLDRQYANPLGGSWQSALYPPGYAGATFLPLPAPGRSFDVAVTFNL